MAGLPGQHLRDGACAAVQIHRQLRTGETGELQRLAVQHLCLGVVHLIKRRHRQPDRPTAQHVRQSALPPKSAVAIPQNGVAGAGIDPQHHAHGLWCRLTQQGHQFRLVGEAFAVHQQAHKALVFTVAPHIQVPHQPPAGGLVVSRHMILRQILPQGRRQCIRLRLLEEAVLHLHHLMAAGPIKAHPAVGGHRVLALIAVAQGLCGTQDFLHGHVAAAQSGQGILNPLALGPQLLGVVQMAEVAAAAAAIVGTVRLLPVGGGAMAQDRLAEGHVFQHLHHQNVAVLAPDGVVDEHHLPVDAGHAQPLTGVALDGTAVYMIFLQCGHSGPPLIWGFSSYFRRVTWRLLARLTTRGHYGFPRPACEPAVGIMHSEKNTVVQGPCGSAEARQRGGQIPAAAIRQHHLRHGLQPNFQQVQLPRLQLLHPARQRMLPVEQKAQLQQPIAVQMRSAQIGIQRGEDAHQAT